MSYQAVPIQDRVDIDNLFSAYAYTLDDGDADAWIALYTDDGVFDVPGLNRFEGQDGLRAIADIVINGSQGNWRHMATNVLVTPGRHSSPSPACAGARRPRRHSHPASPAR